MINTKDYDFSFSGLKTAVLYAWQKLVDNGAVFASSKKTRQLQIEFSAEIQQAIIDVLVKKTMKAVRDFNAKSLILGGGVSANKELRKQFKIALEKKVVANLTNDKNATTIKLFVPEPKLSTDNGLMVAVAGYFNRKKTVAWKNISADGNLRISK
jgi:N6-L-threonylcarbamoyladenine synthase